MNSDAHIIVKGFVQGVGYRNFVRKQAEKQNLTGWVRNLPDGTVEILIQGKRNHIEAILDIFRKGSFLSEVTTVDVLWEKQKENFLNFSIRHDF